MQTTNSKQQKTLERIFTTPVPNNILWSEIESLLRNLGCVIQYKGGSKVKIAKDTEKALIHRPHPGNQTPPETVIDIRTMLTNIGVTP